MMNRNNPAFYLPIRAFGDFIITASVVKGRFKEKIPILLPGYFDGLFRAIGAGEYFEIAGTIPFDNQPIFFQLYTVTSLKNLLQLNKDFTTICAAVKRMDSYLLDYSSRRLFFTGAHFFWPDKKENAYEGKLALFSRFFDCEPVRQAAQIGMPKLDKNSRVLILPDSRVPAKRIDPGLVGQIRDHFSGVTIDAASFSMEMPADGSKVYQDFNQLITLIGSYDLVIGAESLPYHLANYLHKPHFVIYNQSRHMKKTFMTPFMVAHQAYSMAEKGHTEHVLKQIGKFFC